MKSAVFFQALVFAVNVAQIVLADGRATGPQIVQSGSTQWRIYCSRTACAATAAELWVICKDEDLFLIGFRDFEVQHWHNRSVQPLPIAESLDDYQIATLMAEGDLILTDEAATHFNRGAPISTKGFEDVLQIMAATVSCLPPSGPMTYRALVDDQSRTNQDQQVPFTKPQIEFAVRAQTANSQ